MDSTSKVLLLAAVLAALVLAVAAALLVRLVRARRDLRRAGLPTGPRWVFWGAVLYFVLPFDVLPDPVYLDDIGVLLLALRTLHGAVGHEATPPVRRPGRFGIRRQHRADDYAP
ncbi:YkvA family protein [Streptomyces sp. NPDC018610]|uniref:YkvA family protein n=1 Tax=Streptomyces sp. NPDC018610 TaxID=3365049 RepID=UPI00378F6468